MNKNNIKIGGVYVAKVSGRLTKVRIERVSPYERGGWFATNLTSGREVFLRTAARLRYEVKDHDQSRTS